MKFVYLVIFSLFYLLGNIHSVNAQGSMSTTDVLPPSPEAASLGKYGDIPVSYHTGTTNVSVPIYTLNGRKLSVPIALNYHTGGIKVEEIASWVGLGWSLQAGGVITRTVRGEPDEQGYINSEAFDEDGTPILPQCENGLAYYQSIIKRNIETQPDQFTFNFMGKSGKFVIDVNGNVKMASQEKLTFQHPFDGTSSNQWILIDESGIQYIFGSYEGRTAIDYSDLSLSNCNGQSPIHTPPHAVTSWYLMAVIAPNTDETIRFHYKANTITYKTAGYSYIDYRLYGTGGAQIDPNICQSTTISHAGNLIEKITSSSGSVEFIPSSESRIDLEPGTSANAKFLKEVHIKDYNGNLIKQVTLEYDYFGPSDKIQAQDNSERNLKLKLLSVQEINGSESKAPYQFSYNDLPNPNSSWPSTTSPNQDLWGYFNGKTNSNLVPKIIVGATTYPGADRSASLPHTQVASLKEIIYPTGGATTFEYELNTYNSSGIELEFEEEIHALEGISVTSPNGDEAQATRSFQIDETIENVIISCTSFGIEDGVFDGGGRVELVYPDGTIKHWEPCPNNSNVTYKLKPGTYQLKADIYSGSEPNASILFSLQYKTIKEKEVENDENRPAGGLRILRMTDKSYSSPDVVTEYRYTTNEGSSDQSSGTLMNLYRFWETYNWDDGIQILSRCEGPTVAAKFLRIKSASNTPLGAVLGYPVGYKEVTVLHGVGGSNGTTTYKYLVTPSIYQDHRNTLVREVITKNAQGHPLKHVINNYNFQYVGAHQIHGFDIKPSVVSGCFHCFHVDYNAELYVHISEWVQLKSTTEFLFNEDNNNYISNITTFEYETIPKHYQIVKQINEDSEGRIHSTTFKYASYFDDNSYGSDLLQNKHMHSQVLEKNTYVNSILTHKSTTKFINKAGNIVPEVSSVYPKGTTLHSDTFYEHDGYGNIIQIADEKGITTSYLWGYNHTLPIAKVIGEEYSEIQGDGKIITNNELTEIQSLDGQDLRNKLQELRDNLPHCMVNTYTYSPLIGIRSSTDENNFDSYFEYDDLNRLQLILDQERDILKKLTYHYGGAKGLEPEP